MQDLMQETFSDHRLVVLTYEDNWTKLYKKVNENKDGGTKMIDTLRLVNEEECRKRYQETLEQKMQESECNTWEELSGVLQEAAVEAVGYKTPNEKHKVDDQQIREMSEVQKKIHIEMTNKQNPTKLEEMRRERKMNAKKIQKRLKRIREEEIDEIEI